jgi:hypothetical protein
VEEAGSTEESQILVSELAIALPELVATMFLFMGRLDPPILI